MCILSEFGMGTSSGIDAEAGAAFKGGLGLCDWLGDCPYLRKQRVPTQLLPTPACPTSGLDSWSQVVHLEVDSFVGTLAPGTGFADLRAKVRAGAKREARRGGRGVGVGSFEGRAERVGLFNCFRGPLSFCCGGGGGERACLSGAPWPVHGSALMLIKLSCKLSYKHMNYFKQS